MADRLKNKESFGLIDTYCPYPDNIDCCDAKCGRPVKFMEKCFIDKKTADVFCNNCGSCVRYERKKADQRKSMGLPEIKINGE